jgi:hypothetical protein
LYVADVTGVPGGNPLRMRFCPASLVMLERLSKIEEVPNQGYDDSQNQNSTEEQH